MTQFSCYPLAKMRSICCVRPLSVFEMRQQASKLANAGEAGDLLAIRAPCLPSLRVPGLLRLGRFKLIMAAAALQQDSLDLCCELSPYPAGDMAIHSLEGAPSSRVTTVTLGFLTRVGARCLRLLMVSNPSPALGQWRIPFSSHEAFMRSTSTCAQSKSQSSFLQENLCYRRASLWGVPADLGKILLMHMHQGWGSTNRSTEKR